MKKLFIILLLASCGPSTEEKIAILKARIERLKEKEAEETKSVTSNRNVYEFLAEAEIDSFLNMNPHGKNFFKWSKAKRDTVEARWEEDYDARVMPIALERIEAEKELDKLLSIK